MRGAQVVVASGVTTTLAGSGSGGVADGTGASATFAQPQGVAVSQDGLNLFVTTRDGESVRKVSFHV